MELISNKVRQHFILQERIQMDELKSTWEKKVNDWDKQTEDSNNYFTRRTNFVVELINKNIEQGAVLDVGCGVGLLSLRLAENGFDTYGTDISENMIHKAIEHLSTKFNNSNDRFRISQNGNIPFPGISFQIITAIGVFPYIENYNSYIMRLSSFIETGGYIIASCTNRFSIYVFLQIYRHILRFRPTISWRTTLLNLVRTGIWSGGHVDYRISKQAYSSSHFDKLFCEHGLKKVDELDLFNISCLDKDPLNRKGFNRVFARCLGWNHIGVYVKLKELNTQRENFTCIRAVLRTLRGILLKS